MSSNNHDPSRPPQEPQQPPTQDLSASSLTIPSDSEPYSSLSPPSTSPPRPQSGQRTQKSPGNNNSNDNDNERGGRDVVIYTKPTFWSLVRGAAINLLLPFVNGMMLGLGELLAHEIAFRWGWGTTQIFPKHRSTTSSSSSSPSRAVGPGIEMRDDPLERQRRRTATGRGAGADPDLMDATALE